METINPLDIRSIKKIVESKETEGLIECLESLEIHADSIGEGGNAEIFAIQEGPFSKVCLKKIKEKPQMLCNDIVRENILQGKARKAGVRTPIALISIETDSDTYLIMERVLGNNVEEIIQNPSLLPENFDYQNFTKDLDIQIETLHNAGIYHRDLHIRNVMINKEGLPVIIDFGTSTEGTGSDFTYEELATVYNSSKNGYEQVSGMFKDDNKMIKNLKSALGPVIINLKLTKSN